MKEDMTDDEDDDHEGRPCKVPACAPKSTQISSYSIMKRQGKEKQAPGRPQCRKGPLLKCCDLTEMRTQQDGSIENKENRRENACGEGNMTRKVEDNGKMTSRRVTSDVDDHPTKSSEFHRFICTDPLRWSVESEPGPACPESLQPRAGG